MVTTRSQHRQLPDLLSCYTQLLKRCWIVKLYFVFVLKLVFFQLTDLPFIIVNTILKGTFAINFHEPTSFIIINTIFKVSLRSIFMKLLRVLIIIAYQNLTTFPPFALQLLILNYYVFFLKISKYEPFQMHFNNCNQSTIFKEPRCTLSSAIIFWILFMSGFCLKLLFDTL